MARSTAQDILMPELDKGEEKAVLRLTTYKITGGIYSSAHIHYLKPDGCILWMPFSDFSRRVGQVTCIRVTQHAIDRQHSCLFVASTIETLKHDARAFYAAKSAAA